ncbi:MAG: MCE family protein [Gemmatimonadaceae bacterium]|nr:MCE family protein [Gemmatimonadaceae bacterium]
MKRSNEILVGLLLLLGGAIAIFGSIWLVRGSLNQGYPLFARFPWGAGLKPGQPVMLAGVTAGSVADVEYDPKGTVRVTLRMNKNFHVPKGSVASSIPVGFFGDRAIAIEPVIGVTEMTPEGDSLIVSKAGATTDEVIATGDSIAKDIRGITLPLRQQLADSGGVQDIREILRSTSALTKQLNGVIIAQNAQLAIAMSSVNRSLRALERTTSALDSMRVDSLTRNAGRATANVAAITDSLRHTMQSLNATMARLERGEGTAGKLLTDSLLYNDVRRLVTRLDSVTADFKRDPRKYIKFSVF